MSFLDLNLQDVPEVQALPDGEYEVRILKAEVKVSAKTGGQFISVSLDVPSEPNSKGISHVLMLPVQTDDEKKRQDRLRAIKHFCEAFKLDYAKGVDLEAAVGAIGWAILGTETSEEYGDQNRVKRFVTGH